MAFKNDFRPDIIAGNPPYANGADIDFIFDAFDVVKIALSEITPAKWQTCDAEQRINSIHSYGDFRNHIVPYIKTVIFYPDAAEIFEIRNTDGITIYCCNKKTIIDKADIFNRNLHQKYFNSHCVRDIKNRETLHNVGYSIVKKVEKFNRFTFENITCNKQYQVWTGNQINSGNGWGFENRKNPCSTFNLDGKFKCIGSSIIADSYKDEHDSRGASTCIFESDNIAECESFVSWLDTKLIRFLVGINIGKLTGIFTNDYFRFVPEPFKRFSEIYTDSEMYEYYQLSNEEIDIIESIILQRKDD